MPPQCKQLQQEDPAPPSRAGKHGRTHATIADLSHDVLLRTLALTGSEAWKECVLTSMYTPERGGELVDIGRMLEWLVFRCKSIESITFRKFKMHNEHGRKLVPFFAAAMGMLAANSPLRILRFEDCMVSPTILPQLRLLATCTSLHLHGVASASFDPYLQLGEILKAMPQLRDVSVMYTSVEPCGALPGGLAACGQLQRCHLIDLRESSHAKELPVSISGLSSLASLSMYGVYVNKISAAIGQLTALRTLRTLVPSSHAPHADALRLPPETSQLAMSLQRLSFCSREVPREVTALQSLSRLSIGGLGWTNDVSTQVAGLSVLTNIANLRFHRCFALTKTYAGLLTLLNALPELKALALDRNGMTNTSLGHAAKRLTSLDLRGSAYGKGGLPTSLRRAVNCQQLQLTVKSWDALTQGNAQPLTSCPLLGMQSLQMLVLQQPAWLNGDVTALLALQRCFQESPSFRGSGPKIASLTDPEKDRLLTRARLVQSSDDEDDI